jgi:hypothetical protein
MTDDTPTLKDIWRLLGTMNKRFDALERQSIETREFVTKQISELRTEFTTEFSALRAEMHAGFGALKAWIEARDFRLDEHGRRITDLETLVRG